MGGFFWLVGGGGDGCVGGYWVGLWVVGGLMREGKKRE